MGSTATILTIAAAALLLFLFFSLLRAPLKLALKLVINAVIGFAVLIVFNYLGAFIGVSIAINWLTAVIAGLLGLPGVALILVLQWLSFI